MSKLTSTLVSCLAPALLAAQGSPERSPMLTSVVDGRRAAELMIDAVGGHQALRSVKNIEIEETIERTARRQGLRPGSPSHEFGVRRVWLDLPGQRFAEMRTLDIEGNQLWDQSRFYGPKGNTDVFWSSMSKDSTPQAIMPSARAAFGRRYLLPLLIRIERSPGSVRAFGVTTVNGRPNDVLTFADADGAILTLLVDRQTHLPTRMEQLVAGSVIGDTVDVSDFSDYRKVGALTLPHRRMEVRNPDVEWDYKTVRMDLDRQFADSVFEVPPGLTMRTPGISRMATLAPDVYLVPNGYQSVFVVFDDYVLVLEAGGSSGQSLNTIARIREVAPGKPIKYVVTTHWHDDHIAGLRPYVAEGTTIVTTADAKAPIEALARVRLMLSPDSLDRAPRAPVIEIVDRKRVFKDAHHEVQLHEIGPTAHVNQIIVAYLPTERLLFEGDLLDGQSGQTAAGGDDTEQFAAKVRALGLAFDRFVPVHGSGVNTAADLEKSLRWGRARARCPKGRERRTPCLIGGFSVREIPTHPERNVKQPAIALPQPTGPHRVGRMSFSAVDSARREVKTPDPADFRELVFHVWYPSDATSGTPASYLDVSLTDAEFRRTIAIVDTLDRVRANALADVAVSRASTRYPVILFSHGLGVLSRTYSSFLENLASHGYIVVGVDHSYYSAPFPLPNGRSVHNLSAQQDRQRDVVAQAEDLSFVVSVLESLNQQTASPTRIAGRMDLEKLGVFGHSRGGFAAPHACRLDPRFKACGNLDGYSMTPAVMDSGIAQPFLFVEEIAPWDPPAVDSQLSRQWTRAQADSQWLADSSRFEATFTRMGSDAFVVISPGAVHNSFSDLGFIAPARYPLARQDFRRTIAITNEYLLAFFDTYLRSRQSALLKGKSAKFPETWLTIYRPGQAKQVFRGAPTWKPAQ